MAWLEARAPLGFLLRTPREMLKRPTQPSSTELGGTQEATGKAGEDREARGFGSTDSALFQKPRAVTQESSIADETAELFRQRPSQHLLANHDRVVRQLQEHHKGSSLPTARRQKTTQLGPKSKVCALQSRGARCSFRDPRSCLAGLSSPRKPESQILGVTHSVGNET